MARSWWQIAGRQLFGPLLTRLVYCDRHPQAVPQPRPYPDSTSKQLFDDIGLPPLDIETDQS
jgi:hypothetical protein